MVSLYELMFINRIIFDVLEDIQNTDRYNWMTDEQFDKSIAFLSKTLEENKKDITEQLNNDQLSSQE